jgi:tetratricopeptide (TPR) repeat protein
MHLVLIFLLLTSISFGQNKTSIAMKYNDSATAITNNYKDFGRGIYYVNKAIETDSNYHPSYENKLRFLLELKRFDEAGQTINKLISLSDDNALYISMSGLILEEKGDSLSAVLKYKEAENKYKTKQDSTPTSNWKYEYIVINRAMNLLFMREDLLAKQICTEYYEKIKKSQSPEWLNRITGLTREYYYRLLIGKEKD